MNIRTKLTINALVFVALGLGLGPSWSDTLDMTIEPNMTESTAQAMIREHACWSGEGPAGVIPGHAVVQMPDDAEPSYVESQIGFDIWLKGKPGRVLAFCR